MTDKDDTSKPVLALPNWTGWTGWTPKPCMGGRDTVNPTRLPLMERIKRKLLVDEPEMVYQEIAWLEFPHHTTARKQWRSEMALAQNCGLLAMHDRLESWPIGENRRRYITSWYIDRNAYKSWRATQPNPPVGSIIHLWLGAKPALSVPAVAQDEPTVGVRGGPEQGVADSDGIALKNAENMALMTLRKELKREPDFEEFWTYMTKRDDTGTIADYTDGHLMWIGKIGQSCQTAKSTMRNRLTATKKRNPFNKL